MSDNLNKWLNSDVINDGNNLKSTDESILKLGNSHRPYNRSIMHEWERPIMELDAKLVTQNGGSILNVGYGMGIIDNYIRSHNPKKHTVIEVHPQIAEIARSKGYNVIEGDWMDIIDDFIKNEIKFDGVYFDTYSFDRPDWFLFSKRVSEILNPEGVYSYFNAAAAHSQGVAKYLKSKGWNFKKYEIEVERINIIEETEVPELYTHVCISWKRNRLFNNI